jgi:hypothetical protein
MNSKYVDSLDSPYMSEHAGYSIMDLASTLQIELISYFTKVQKVKKSNKMF